MPVRHVALRPVLPPTRAGTPAYNRHTAYVLYTYSARHRRNQYATSVRSPASHPPLGEPPPSPAPGSDLAPPSACFRHVANDASLRRPSAPSARRASKKSRMSDGVSERTCVKDPPSMHPSRHFHTVNKVMSASAPDACMRDGPTLRDMTGEAMIYSTRTAAAISASRCHL